jgi:sugar phosphate isomerase/epimerase
VTDEHLLATCWTTAGDAAPLRGDQRSPLPLRDRIEAAAAAGFRGFGLLDADLLVAEQQYGLATIRTMLEDHAILHIELELLTDWWATGATRQLSDQVRRHLLSAAETLGAHHIKIAPDVTDAPYDHDRWVTEFAALAADAEKAGTRVGLEFLPWSNIKTVHEALALVRDADHPAGGMIIDCWHTERAHTPTSHLATVPPRYITGVELSDADAQPVGTLFEDTINRRRLCGQGTFDLTGFVQALRDAGWHGPWGVEILSEQHRRTPLPLAVTTAYQTANQYVNTPPRYQ